MKPAVAPDIHYDRMLGGSPRWREAIWAALKGHPDLFRSEFLALSGWAPSAAKTLSACYEYAKSGQQVFCVGPHLQEMLHYTDLSGVPEAFLRLPFPCFYVALPQCPWSIWGGDRTQWHPVSGVYVQRRGTVLSFIFWGKETDKSACIGDDAVFWLDLQLNECLGKDEDTPGAFDIGTQLQKQLSDLSRDASDPLAPKWDTARGRQNETLTSVLRVVINLVLYLNSSDPETTLVSDGGPERAELKKKVKRTKNKGKRRRYQKRLAELSEAKVVWIGKSIEDGKIRPRRATKTSSRAVKPHWRKGHFHPYWVGLRRDAEGNHRKGDHQVLKWVAPVFVGDMADLVRSRGRIYMFTEDHAP